MYGTTSGGGANGFGVAFKVTTAGVFTKLADFTGASGLAKGSVPGDLVMHADGLFYGTTQGGGANGLGTVFSMTAAGGVTTLLEFTGTAGAVKGSMPIGRLAVSGTNLYGMTSGGGTANLGTVYKVTTGGAWSALRPTSVLKWIPQPDMGGKESVSYPANTDRHILSAAS